MNERVEPRSPQDLEFFYVAGMATAGTVPHVAREEFKATIAQVRREAKVEALREMADQIHQDLRANYRPAEEQDAYLDMMVELLSRANQLEQEGKNDD